MVAYAGVRTSPWFLLTSDLVDGSVDGFVERCMPFTDLANPTSNKIYAEVGYRRLGDWEQHVFVPRLAPT